MIFLIANPANLGEKRCNVAHLRTRNAVKRTIGAYKRYFRCLTQASATNIPIICPSDLNIDIIENLLSNQIQGLKKYFS